MQFFAYIMTSMPWLAGGLVALTLQRIFELRKREKTVARNKLSTVFTFGLGGLLGYLTLGYALWALDEFGFQTLTLTLNAVISGIAFTALITLWCLARRVNIPIDWATTWPLNALLITLMAYAVYMHSQNPLSAWDGLNHWGYNAAEFVKEETTSELANFNWHYLERHPKTIVLIYAWAGWVSFDQGGSGWALPWSLCMTSVCLMGAGYVYEATKSQPLSTLCAVLLATIPLAEAHTLIAGYADLWLSAVVLAGLLLSAMGLQQQNFYLLTAGILIGTLAITIKNTGLVYSLCVWGAVALTVILRRPTIGAIMALIMAGGAYWIWTQGFEINFLGLQLQRWEGRQVLTFAGYRQMDLTLHPVSQIGINELYSLVINQSFNTAGLIFIFSTFALFSANTQSSLNQKQPHTTAVTFPVHKRDCAVLLILGAALILIMLILSQIFIIQGYAHALPGADTGNSRFSLSLPLVAITAALSMPGLSLLEKANQTNGNNGDL